MPHLLVVDSEPSVQSSLEKSLRSPTLHVSACGTVSDALRLARQSAPDVIILDVGLPHVSGLETYDSIRAELPRLPVILMTGCATTDTAIEAMKRGAFDYLTKPVDLDRLRGAVSRALEVTELSRARGPELHGDGMLGAEAEDTMIGQSQAMQEVYKSIGRVASQDVSVLVLGESGTGKELVARAICRYSNRSQKPFVAINCAAIPDTLLESELFGHEKGAFTGADDRRAGKFEQAHGGTVFLDEIGDMSSTTQAKVLRLIQEQRFERVGGTQTVQTDVRVIAASNKSLPDMVAEGTFRQDLYYRINGFTILLPPLRQRHGDVQLLTNYFIQRLNREMGKTVRAIAPEALHWLQLHSWPGNVRELQSTIKYALIKAMGDVVTLSCLPPNVAALDVPASGAALPADYPLLGNLARDLLQSSPGTAYRRFTSVVDSVVVREALSQARGNQLHAAALLGISRTTLRAKLRSLGLSVEKQLSVDGSLD